MPIAQLRPRRLVARPVSPSRRRRPVPLTVEPLDDRVLPSATMVAQINHATADALDPSLAAVSFHGALYFTADDGHGGGVFRSDGTTAGTTLIKAFPMTDAYVPHALVVSGGSLFFTGIPLNDMGMVLEGAIPAALMALAAQGLFELAERAVVPRGLRLRAE